MEGEGEEVLETIRVQPQQAQTMPYPTPESVNPVSETTSDSHPSWWIQDFLHTTLGIARRKKGSPESPDINKDGKSDPDPASTSGQIQLWQVGFPHTKMTRVNHLTNVFDFYFVVFTGIVGRSAIKCRLDCVGRKPR